MRARRCAARSRRSSGASTSSPSPPSRRPAPSIADPTVHLPSGPHAADSANVRQTGLGNLTGVPGINVPAGFHSSGLPIGLQLMGPWDAEARLLDAAKHIEQATSREFVDAVPPDLLVAVRDPAAIEVVGRQLDLHLVAGKDADVVAPHLSGDVAEDLMVVLELDPEHGVGESLEDLPLHLDLFFFGHCSRA